MARADDARREVGEDGVVRYRRAAGPVRRQVSQVARTFSDAQVDGDEPIADEELSQAIGGMSVDNLLKNKSHSWKKRHGLNKPRSLDVLLRRAKALELRRAGFTWQEIANRRSLGYTSARHAERDVHRLLQQMIDTPAKEVLALELSRLDAITQVLWQQVRGGELAAIRELLQTMRMRQDLLGLHSINVMHQHVTVNELDKEIERLTKEVAAVDAQQAINQARDHGGSSVSDVDELEAAARAAGLITDE